MKEDKVAAEVAEEEFDRWAEAMDLEVEGLDSDDLQSFNQQRAKIVRAIRKGHLVINDEDLAVYTPWKSTYDKPIVFHERTGASLMAADHAKKDANVAKMYAILADMTRTNAPLFASLKGPDIKVCEALFALLMG